MGVDFQLSK